MRDFWAEEVKKAEREMRQSKSQIESTKRGTASGRKTDWTLKSKKPKGRAS